MAFYQAKQATRFLWIRQAVSAGSIANHYFDGHLVICRCIFVLEVWSFRTLDSKIDLGMLLLTLKEDLYNPVGTSEMNTIAHLMKDKICIPSMVLVT